MATVPIPARLRRRLQAEADREGKTVEALVEDILADRLDRVDAVERFIREAGLDTPKGPRPSRRTRKAASR